MTCYVLDTSAIRAVSRADLEVAKATHDLRMSPWSFWELLSHLDESEKHSTPQESFRRRRGQVLKCELLGVLDEPLAEHAAEVGVPQLANPTRFEDRVMVNEILGRLKTSDSIEALYASRVTFPSGEGAVLDGLASNVRKELETEENRYVTHVRGLITLLNETFDLATIKTLPDAEFASMAVAPCRKLVEKYRADGVDDPELLPKIIDNLYLHLAYKLGRSRKYLLDVGGVPAAVTIDPNDFEDGAIAGHIHLLSSRVLVTEDDGTARELNYALAALSRSCGSWGVTIPVNCRVLGVKDFLREVLAPAPSDPRESSSDPKGHVGGPQERKAPRRLLGWAVLAALALLGAVVAAWFLSSRKPPTSDSP